MEFCTVESLGIIGNMIGRMIKIDRSTSIYDKGAFARICVEVDLQKPLLPAFTVYGEDKQLVYEGLHLVCFGCGLYGHEQKGCPSRKEGDSGHGAEMERSKNDLEVEDGKSKTEETSKEKKQSSEQSAGATGAPTTESSGGNKHLGPQMILRRDFRGSIQSMEKKGGIKGGMAEITQSAKKEGKNMERLRGAEVMGLKEKKIEKAGEKLVGINAPKDMAEWVIVGSKRKKAVGSVVIGKENRGKSKMKYKAINHRGTHLMETTNTFSSLQAINPDCTDQGGIINEPAQDDVMEGPTQELEKALTQPQTDAKMDLMDAKMGLNAKGVEIANVDNSLGCGLAPTTSHLSL